MIKSIKYITVALFLFTGLSIYAQRWSAEFRPGVNFPVEELSSGGYKLGYGFETTVSYRMMPHLRATGGWSWNSFETDNDAKRGTHFYENSFIFGFELQLPITEPPLTYHLFARSILGQLRYEDNLNNIDARSSYELGFEVGGAVAIWLDDKWVIRPDLRYRYISAELDYPQGPFETDLKYIALGAGLEYNF